MIATLHQQLHAVIAELQFSAPPALASELRRLSLSRRHDLAVVRRLILKPDIGMSLKCELFPGSDSSPKRI
jgi:hypothetical protein